jgi:adenosylmethionine-8-amino-7-oxononanoate aminotransferase
MIVDIVVTATAQMIESGEMEIITEEVAEPAHALEALIEIRGVREESAASVMIRIRDRGMIVAIEMNRAEQVEVRSARARLH